MGYCKLECPDGETECCICCTKQDSCQHRCDEMDSYEYAEECQDYENRRNNYMYDWEDQKFYESSQYPNEIEALQSAIRSSIRKEVLEEMNQLQEENKKLQGIKENFESVRRDYERKKSECDRIIANAEYKARTARFSELMEDHKVIRWSVDWKLAYGAKCDMCDASRYINVTLPSGRTVEDRCKCHTDSRRLFFPAPCALYRISDEYGLMGWYKECTSSDEKKYYISSNDYFTICDRNNKEAMEELKRHEEQKIEKVLYDSKEECQKICDKLNEKEGHPEWIYAIDGTTIATEEGTVCD